MLVVDASVLVVALADDGPDGDQARARLRGVTFESFAERGSLVSGGDPAFQIEKNDAFPLAVCDFEAHVSDDAVSA